MARTQTFRATAQKATPVLVKGAAAELCWKHVQNLDATDAYLHFYDAATTAAVTVGSTVPKLSLWIPASSGLDDGPVMVNNTGNGIEFASGIVIAATTTLGGSANPTNGELVNLVYV